MNDSFVDFDLIGQVDPENFKVKKLSFFAELIWEARMKRSKATIAENRPEMDWIVVRNRTGHIEAKNQARLERALKDMAQRVGFRAVKGLSERVIYRELFPSGLTLLDKGYLGELGTSHLVARQERPALDRHQRRGHDEEVARDLDVHVLERLEVLEVPLDDPVDLDLVDLDLLLPHEVQQEVHRALEDLVELDREVATHHGPPVRKSTASIMGSIVPMMILPNAPEKKSANTMIIVSRTPSPMAADR